MNDVDDDRKCGSDKASRYKELLEAAKVLEEAFVMGSMADIQIALKHLRLAILKCEAV